MKNILSLNSRNSQLRKGKKCVNNKAMTRWLKYGKYEQHLRGLVGGRIPRWPPRLTARLL